jgi:hypothetical protein
MADARENPAGLVRVADRFTKRFNGHVGKNFESHFHQCIEHG